MTMIMAMVIRMAKDNAGDVDKYYHNDEISVQSEQSICTKPKPPQPLSREPDCSYHTPAAQVKKTYKSFFLKEISNFNPAFFSSASSPLLPTSTTLFQQMKSPSLLPRSLSPARQPSTTSSLSPQYSVAWNSFRKQNYPSFAQRKLSPIYHDTIIMMVVYRPRLVGSEPASSSALLQAGQRSKHLRHRLPFRENEDESQEEPR